MCYCCSIKPATHMNKNTRVLWSLIGTVTLTLSVAAAGAATANSTPDLQPLAAQVQRLTEALDYLGAPLTSDERARLREASSQSDPAAGTAIIESVLAP